MTVPLSLAWATALLTAIALFAPEEESDAEGERFDYWASPDPFLYMSRVTSALHAR